MNIFTALFGVLSGHKRMVRKSLDEYKQEVLLRQGKAQFEKLVKKGLSVPIVLL
ncbi:MAG TPA: hypothetical protein VF189_01275 [Patescibacteria group bacterium]